MSKTQGQSDSDSIVLFDGVCNLCSFWVDFVMRRDEDHRFRFASLQSDVAQRLLNDAGSKQPPLASIVLIENGQLYRESTAILRICRRLAFPWHFFYVLIVFPSFLRDVVYRFIAKHRYRVFGKRDTCRLPTAQETDRFLVD